MPMRELYVEGELDAALLNTIRSQGGYLFNVVAKGSKDGLRPKVIAQRTDLKSDSIFLFRDRDFDFDVEPHVVVPPIIEHEGIAIGWHWCRHEAENFLLEPSLLSQFLSIVTKRTIRSEEVELAIADAAKSIRFYQAARWTIGISKRRGLLPPPHDLGTRPPIKEFRLPREIGKGWCEDWVLTSTQVFLQTVHGVLNEEEVSRKFQQYEQQFNETQCQDVKWVLHTFSGKDLFVALKPWFESIGIQRNTEKLILDVAEFIAYNPDLALDCLEEWRALLGEFQKYA